MTKFNPENKETLTYGEALGPAMEIIDKEDALQYKRDYIAHTQKYVDEDKNNHLSAEEIVNQNLGYYAGYYSDETRKRVEELFECSHPVFGKFIK